MDSEERRREAIVGSAARETDPRKKQVSNATALIVLGLVLFFLGGALASSTGKPGGLLFGVLGVGLIVAGIVIRPRP